MRKMTKELVSNKKAFYNYEILETFEAGIALVGSEIKSLRSHGGNLQDAYVATTKGELFLLQASIAPYSYATVYNHEERRPRKLLMHKNEILRLSAKITEKGIALVPLSLYLKEGRVKVKLALVKGKKQHDKRRAKMEKEKKREVQSAVKRHLG